jgi:hypothetical protein
MADPGTDLVRRTSAPVILSDDELRREWRMAEALAQSKAFPDPEGGKLTTALAFARMVIGHDLGLSPTQSLMGVSIVKGRPMIAATTLAGFVKRTPGYDYRVIEHDAEKCSIDFTIDGEVVGNSTYTIEDAKLAKLVKSGGAWETVPRNMVFARAMSNGVRWYMPDVTGGVAAYVEGELTEGPPLLTEGSGSGEAQGIDLGPKVDEVIARATELGHAGLADRATAEMALGGRSPEVTVKWVADAKAELSAFEAESPPDAEVVEPIGEADPAEQIKELERIAKQLDKDAKAADDEGKPGDAEDLRKGAVELREQIKALAAGNG